MSTDRYSGDRRKPRLWGLGRAMTASAVASIAFASVAMQVGASTTPVLQADNVTGYTGVLANHASFTLYVLSVEKGAKLHCKAGCLKIWPPLLVSLSTKTIKLGTGVKGKIGFIKRSATKKQVTFNTYPVYVYSGDTGAKQSNGENIKADGGTWTMALAKATTAAATPIPPKVAPPAQLQTKSVTYYSNVLANSASQSMYLLSTEKGAVISCTGTCLNTWFPFEVTSNTKPVTVSTGVKGTVGFVSRGTNLWQVTFNSYPIYRLNGDTGSTGEGLAADGGTWFLLHAGATTPDTTPVPVFTG